MPMNVYISEDGEWAFLALDLCVSCLPGCEQRLFTYCTRLCMDAEQICTGDISSASRSGAVFLCQYSNRLCA